MSFLKVWMRLMMFYRNNKNNNKSKLCDFVFFITVFNLIYVNIIKMEENLKYGHYIVISGFWKEKNKKNEFINGMLSGLGYSILEVYLFSLASMIQMSISKKFNSNVMILQLKMC